MSTASGTAQKLIDRFMTHRRAVVALADKLPEFTAGWRPWSDGRTTLELLNHLVVGAEFFLAAAAQRPMNQVGQGATIAEARQILAEQGEAIAAEISRLTEADLEKPAHLSLLKLTEPAGDALHRMIVHEAHHKGQIWIYARMQGVEPPFFMA